MSRIDYQTYDRTSNGINSGRFRRELSAEYPHRELGLNKNMSTIYNMEYKHLRGSLKGVSSVSEDIPTVLGLQLAVAKGPDRLPADRDMQEVLCGKLRMLETDLTNITTLITELSAHLVSINSDERTIFISFKSFEEIWKFSTYHKMGFQHQCLENFLLDQNYWLNSLEQNDSGIVVFFKEETLNLMYRDFLMQEGSFFGSCSVNQMFDSSTSGSDLYLEKGVIAMFEPPFLDSGWTVMSLADGSRGTKPRPAVEQVIPFHEWFLKSCPEWALVGSEIACCGLPFQIAVGVCEATDSYDGNGPDELSFEAGDCITILGFLVTCFEWFIGKLEQTGETGLVKTSLVKATDSLCESEQILLKNENSEIFTLEQDKITKETLAFLKKTCQNDVATVYKLGQVVTFLKSKNKVEFHYRALAT